MVLVFVEACILRIYIYITLKPIFKGFWESLQAIPDMNLDTRTLNQGLYVKSANMFSFRVLLLLIRQFTLCCKTRHW